MKCNSRESRQWRKENIDAHSAFQRPSSKCIQPSETHSVSWKQIVIMNLTNSLNANELIESKRARCVKRTIFSNHFFAFFFFLFYSVFSQLRFSLSRRSSVFEYNIASQWEVLIERESNENKLSLSDHCSVDFSGVKIQNMKHQIVVDDKFCIAVASIFNYFVNFQLQWRNRVALRALFIYYFFLFVLRGRQYTRVCDVRLKGRIN